MLPDFFDKADINHTFALNIQHVFIGEHINRFREWVNLIDRLIELMESCPYLCQNSEPWADTLTTLRLMQAHLNRNEILPVGKSAHSSNVMRGKFTNFPIASALLASPEDRVKKQYQGLCVLLIFHLVIKGDSSGYESIAIKLRQLSDSNPEHISLLLNLPTLDGTLTEFAQNIIASLKAISEQNTNKRTIEFIDPINRLAHKKILLSGFSRTPNSHTSRNPRRTIKSEDMTDDSLQERGDIEEIQIKHVDDNEYPTTDFIWSEKTTPVDNAPLPLEAICAGTRTSRFWIRKHHNVTMYDGSHLTGIERRRLMKFINNGLKSDLNEDKCPALIISIAYLTPLTITDVMHTLNTPNQQTITLSGSITRLLPAPEDGFSPPAGASGGLCPTTDHIDLPLYDLIQTCLTNIDMTGKKSIFQQLGMSTEVAEKHLDTALIKLRSNGQYRITQKRIDSALNIELSLQEKNPVITHMLTSSEKQAAPMLAYYAAISTKKLLDAYKSATYSMMAD